MNRENCSTPFKEIFKQLYETFPGFVLALLLGFQNVQASSECRPVKQIFEYGSGAVPDYDFAIVGVEVRQVVSTGPNAAVAHIDVVYRFPLEVEGVIQKTVMARKTIKKVVYDPVMPKRVVLSASDILPGSHDTPTYFDMPTLKDSLLPACP